jgi:hypothetical protein
VKFDAEQKNTTSCFVATFSAQRLVFKRRNSSRPMRKFWPKHINKEIARLLELLRLRFSSTSAHKEWPLPTAAPSHNAMAPCTLANGPNGAHLTRGSIGTPGISGLAGNTHTRARARLPRKRATAHRRCYFGAPQPRALQMNE